MTNDLVKRLRSMEVFIMDGCISPVAYEAADRIEKLEKALQRANETTEDYERRFYLGTDRIEELQDIIARIQYTNLRRDMNLKNRTITIDTLCKGGRDERRAERENSETVE